MYRPFMKKYVFVGEGDISLASFDAGNILHTYAISSKVETTLYQVQARQEQVMWQES